MNAATFNEAHAALMLRERDVARELEVIRAARYALEDTYARTLDAKFPATWCSQCGREFGPGNHGYSSCAEHTLRVIA